MKWWLLLVIFTLISSAHSKPFQKEDGSTEVCKEKECVDAANHILKWMNPAFHPCDDFYEFTCGYWHSPDNKTINKQHNQTLDLNADIVADYLKIFMTDKTVLQESTIYSVLRNFVALCLDEDSIKTLGVSPALDVLQNMGGWPVLDKGWTGEEWDLIKTQINLERSLLTFDFTTYNNSKIVLKVSAPEFPDVPSKKELTEDLKNEAIMKYLKKMCDLAEAFGADRTYAEKELKEALEFQMALVELSSSTNETWHDEVGYNISTLQREIPWVNWTRLITGVLPKTVDIKDDDVISIARPKLLTELGAFINIFPKKVVANYVMWRAAASMAPFLTPEVANIINPSNNTRYEHCVKEVKKNSLAPIIAFYIASKMSEDIKMAKEISKEIKQQLLIEIQEMSWLDEKSREEATTKISNTSISVSFPDQLSDNSQMEAFYKHVKTDFTSFFEAALYMKNWDEIKKFSMIGHPNSLEFARSTLLYLTLTVQAALGIEASMGSNVVISPGMLHILPLFNSKLPSYMNYGHLGETVAHEMIHAIDIKIQEPLSSFDSIQMDWLKKIYGGFNTAHKDISFRWGNNETAELYLKKAKCVENQYSSFNDTKTTNLKLNGTLTNSEDIADIGGFKLALRTYQRVVAKMSTPEPMLPNLEKYTYEQLFMIGVANSYCVIPNYEEFIKSVKYNPHSLWEFRLRGMMMNSPDFNKAFHCEKGDPMNPLDKCEVW